MKSPKVTPDVFKRSFWEWILSGDVTSCSVLQTLSVINVADVILFQKALEACNNKQSFLVPGY